MTNQKPFTFDLSLWGVLPRSGAPYEYDLGLYGIDYEDTVEHAVLFLHPNQPEHSYLSLILNNHDGRVGCFDEGVIRRAFLVGVSYSVHSDFSEREQQGIENLAAGRWVTDLGERYKLVSFD